MAALPEASPCFAGLFHVPVVEGDDPDVEFVEEGLQIISGIDAAPGLQDHHGFEPIDRRHPEMARSGHSALQPISFGLTEQDRKERGGIKDHYLGTPISS